MKKMPWIVSVVCIALTCAASYGYYIKNQQNQKLSLMNLIYEAENRILKEEIAELEKRPTYEQGCKDAIIKMGGPQYPGSYKDGWDAAVLTFDTKSYSDGYHTAIQQFGYQKSKGDRWLIEDPTNNIDPAPTPSKNDQEIVPAKHSEK